jgi:hypothetical protein
LLTDEGPAIAGKAGPRFNFRNLTAYAPAADPFGPGPLLQKAPRFDVLLRLIVRFGEFGEGGTPERSTRALATVYVFSRPQMSLTIPGRWKFASDCTSNQLNRVRESHDGTQEGKRPTAVGCFRGWCWPSRGGISGNRLDTARKFCLHHSRHAGLEGAMISRPDQDLCARTDAPA